VGVFLLFLFWGRKEEKWDLFIKKMEVSMCVCVRRKMGINIVVRRWGCERERE
jgi:hypothetical protein